MTFDFGAFMTAAITALASAGGAWAAVRVELKYHRRDIDDTIKRVRSLELWRNNR